MAPQPPGQRPRPVEPSVTNRRSNVAVTIEDQVRYAYFTPAPNTYDPKNPNVPDLSEPRSLGKISDAKVPSALDHAPRTKSYVPGPGSYNTPETKDFALPEGGRLNRQPPQEKFKLDEYPQPSPCDYGVPGDPNRPRQLYGRFSRDPKVTKFIRDEVLRSRSIPGPGAHDVHEAGESVNPFCPEGGHTLHSSKPPSYFDQAPKLADSKPGPDAYNLPGSINAKTAGRVVYRYESATMEETKQLLTKIAGESHNAPGPGTYSVPNPAPLNSAPTLKGRAVGHSMPHPFAYNCTPDYARNFSRLTPVRQHSSSEQIFGTGVRRGASSGGSSRGSRPSSAGRGDHLQSQDLPAGLGPIEEDQPEEAVQWKTGGFPGLKKSRSAGSVRHVPEHPSVQAFAKFYPSLSRKHKRVSSTFLPMASKGSRSEAINTHDESEEYQRLCRGKWQLAAVAEGIKNATSAALEPLNLEKMKQQAMQGLLDKTHERMLLEGMSKEQRDRTMEEMKDLLEQQTKSKIRTVRETSQPAIESSEDVIEETVKNQSVTA